MGVDALLDLGFTATGSGPRAALGLRAAAIGGRLSLDAGTVTSGCTSGQPGEYRERSTWRAPRSAATC